MADRLSHTDSPPSPCPPRWQTNTRASIQLPAALEAAFADPAHDRIADIIATLATTLTSQLARKETDAFP